MPPPPDPASALLSKQLHKNSTLTTSFLFILRWLHITIEKKIFRIRSPSLCSLLKTFALGKFIIAFSHFPFFCFSGCSFCLECSNKQTIFLRLKSRVASVMPLLKLDWTIPLYGVGAHLCALGICNPLVRWFLNTYSTRTRGSMSNMVFTSPVYAQWLGLEGRKEKKNINRTKRSGWNAHTFENNSTLKNVFYRWCICAQTHVEKC